ncbi:MAG: hypothetical protein H6Q73_207 [Firmicutes bacterium]|nr:hypothetical protein [Bacillota bacterium]
MTVSNTVTKNTYTCNSATYVFAYTFDITESSDIHLYQTYDGTTTEITSGFTVDTTNKEVTYSAAASLDSNYTITLAREIGLTQSISLQNQGEYFAKTHEGEFDKLTMINQQQQETLDRSLKAPVSVDTSTVDMTLPTPTAGKTIKWNSTATGWELASDPDVAATAAATSESNAATSESNAEKYAANAKNSEENAATYEEEAKAHAEASAAADVSGLTNYTGTAKLADIKAKGPLVDIRAFGCVGDGTTDDTEDFLLAASYVLENSLGLLIPAGHTFLLSSALTADYINGLVIVGQGPTSILYFSGDINCFDMTNVVNADVSNLKIQVDTTNTSSIFYLYGTTTSIIKNKFRDIIVDTTTSAIGNYTGFYLYSSSKGVWNNSFNNLQIRNSLYGVKCEIAASSSAWITANEFNNINIIGIGDSGIGFYITRASTTKGQISNIAVNNLLIQDTNSSDTGTRYGIYLAGWGHSFTNVNMHDDSSTGTFKQVGGSASGTTIQFASAEGDCTFQDLTAANISGMAIQNQNVDNVPQFLAFIQSPQNQILNPQFKYGTDKWDTKDCTDTVTSDTTSPAGNMVALSKSVTTRGHFYQTAINPYYLRGMTVTFFAEVATSTDNSLLLYVSDYTTSSTTENNAEVSGYLTGDGVRRIVSRTFTVSSTATKVIFGIALDGDTDATADVYWASVVIGCAAPLQPIGEPNFKDRSKGTITVTATSTSVTFSHGCAVTPTAADFHIVPTSSLGSASYYYISSVTSSSATLALDAAPASVVTFEYKCHVN